MPGEAGQPVSYLRTLASHKGTIALFALAGALLGALLVWRQPYIYQSHLFLEVRGINEDLLNQREFDPSAQRDNSSQSYVNTEARILKSTPLFERTAANLNKSAAWKPPVTPREIAGAVRVRTNDGDRILELISESPDPKRAAAIANGLAQEFIQQDLKSRLESTQTTSAWLSQELADLAAKLRSSEDALRKFTMSSNLLIDGADDTAATSRFRDVQDELVRAEADRISKESLYDNARGLQSTADGVLPDNQADQYELQLMGLNKQLAELEATYTPSYYKIPPLKAEIAAIQKALARQRQTSMQRVESDYRAAERREALLQSQFDTQFKAAAGNTAKMVEYSALKNEVDTNRAIYAQMLEKVKGYSVTAAMQPSNLRVVDPAEPPLFPSRPNKPLATILTSLGFFSIGILWVLARASASSHITKPGETQRYLHSPELGVIPTATRQTRAGDPTNSADQQQLETIAWHTGPCMVAESFRSTSASLLLSRQGGERPRVLVISSVSPGEGKTTVASNMAIALAGAAGRVLLIDGDRRRGRLHKVFGCDNSRGLSELLLRQSLGENLVPEGFVQPTMVPNLFLLPSGRAALHTSDPFYSARMEGLVDHFRTKFDSVIIDTAPLLHLPDARILGRLSDGVILVLRAAKVRRESAAAAEQRLYQDGIPVLGTVLNDWDPKKNGYGVYPDDKKHYSYFAT
ncbi:MAG TPA: polysaccharide biosynthesis tyrosine autokinase [Bryobacteraceae bacterium]|nr:polysaccharide biosynthesis tyrosine autokinase [Bryobacteraceae bacterium]